jgi:superoxide reductase
MAQRLEIYKCEKCGNIVEVLAGGPGTLECCKMPMILLPVKTEDEGKEKHIPVIEKEGDDTFVKVGSVPHPMLENHFIQWVDVVRPNRVVRGFFNPGDEPKMKI